MNQPSAGGDARMPGAGEFVIAIDGPSGTGKSTVSRRLATRLGAGYLDTGAMYRIVTLAMLRAGIDPADESAVADHLPLVEFDSPTDPQQQRHWLSGIEVTDDIRGERVTLAVSAVSANPAVRAWLLDRQQRWARDGRMVIEGRDIGTVIAPDAPLKIYLTADEAERARRRHRQNTSDGAGLAAVRADLARRDTHDASRRAAPLRAADDAIEVDTSALSADQVVETIVQLAAERGLR